MTTAITRPQQRTLSVRPEQSTVITCHPCGRFAGNVADHVLETGHLVTKVAVTITTFSPAEPAVCGKATWRGTACALPAGHPQPCDAGEVTE